MHFSSVCHLESLTANKTGFLPEKAGNSLLPYADRGLIVRFVMSEVDQQLQREQCDTFVEFGIRLYTELLFIRSFALTYKWFHPGVKILFYLCQSLLYISNYFVVTLIMSAQEPEKKKERVYNYIFHEEWEEKYVFIHIKNKCICLI